ncbi:MAG: gas vesicle protein GvpL [Candidatus Bathyarchaeia archaeon]
MTQMEVTQETLLKEGRYIYCIINSHEKLAIRKAGLDNADIYTVSYEDIGAILHACPAKPYESKEANKVKQWIFNHNNVIDKASEIFGAILPLSFDAIIKGGDADVVDWLSKGYKKLKKELERLKDKAEYTVQIFCEPDQITDKIVAEDDTLRELKEKVEKTPKRTAYLLHRKFELKMKDASNAIAIKLAEEFASTLREHVEEIKIANVHHVPERFKDKKLIASFSCLVLNDKVQNLGKTLGTINGQQGYAVRFTGPWAPFSFSKLGEI